MPAKGKGKEGKEAVKKTKAGKVDKPKAEKKVKDPNAPKRASGAYMWFCKEHREVVKKEHPDMKVTEIGKRLGELWHEMSDSEKKKFQAQAEEDKARYAREMAAYKGAQADADDDADADEEE